MLAMPEWLLALRSTHIPVGRDLYHPRRLPSLQWLHPALGRLLIVDLLPGVSHSQPVALAIAVVERVVWRVSNGRVGTSQSLCSHRK